MQNCGQGGGVQPADEFRAARTPILTLDVIGQRDAADRQTGGNPDFKRITFLAAGDRANERQPDKLVVSLGRKHNRRTATALLVSGLRIKIKPDEIALRGDVAGFFHQISLPIGLPQSVSG